ncbi:MAG: hypothetical protein RLZZ15_1487 [Verrucomicrobiota bacterium]|jgi:hypothetical protein
MKRNPFGLLLISAVLAVANPVGAAEPKSFEDELYEAIKLIAARRGLSDGEAMKRAFAVANDSPAWPVKGGVATLGSGRYVLARGTNGVIANGNAVEGLNWKSPELFVFAGTNYIGRLAVPKSDVNHVTVVLFTPERVRFFDWATLKGGYYPRSPE